MPVTGFRRLARRLLIPTRRRHRKPRPRDWTVEIDAVENAVFRVWGSSNGYSCSCYHQLAGTFWPDAEMLCNGAVGSATSSKAKSNLCSLRRHDPAHPSVGRLRKKPDSYPLAWPESAATDERWSLVNV